MIQKKIKERNYKNKSIDENTNNREFGLEISNINKKSKKYPKREKSNNIFIYPKEKSISYDKKIKKRYPKKKLNKPSKSKIKSIIKNANKIEDQDSNTKINRYNNNKIFNSNPIEEYEREIMNYLFQEETNNRANYSLFPNMEEKNNNKMIISYLKRFSFINLFISFQREFSLRQETLYLSINLFDRYIQKIFSENKITEDLNLIALTCLFIASKYEEIYPPYLKDFLDIFKNKYNKEEIFSKENDILSSLDFQILIISPILFLKKFCFEEKNENEENMNLCFNGAQFFLELCIIEPKFCELKPSLQASICLYLSRKFLLDCYNEKVWTYNLSFRTNCSEIEIKRYIKIALKTIKNFFGNIYTKNFMAIPLYIKYHSLDYSRVSFELKKKFINE
jgi:hypothetical protein